MMITVAATAAALAGAAQEAAERPDEAPSGAAGGFSDDFVRFALDTFDDSRRQVIMWESGGRIFDGGYAVEVRVRLKSIRFPSVPVEAFRFRGVRPGAEGVFVKLPTGSGGRAENQPRNKRYGDDEMTMRTIGAVAATGLVSVVLLNLLAAVAAPLLGMFVSFLALAFKVGLALGVCYFVYRMFRRRRDEMAA